MFTYIFESSAYSSLPYKFYSIISLIYRKVFVDNHNYFKFICIFPRENFWASQKCLKLCWLSFDKFGNYVIATKFTDTYKEYLIRLLIYGTKTSENA